MRRVIAPAPNARFEEGPVPSFSIVIPAYQSAQSIADTVASALSQTLEPYQVIVCDDGSTDDVVSALAPFWERIVLLRRPHRGAGAARNAALRVASGDFVVMLDADDVYEPDRLSALGELAAARPDLDILGTDAYFEVETGLNGRFYEFTEFELEEQRLGIIERCFVAWPALRRARVLEIGGFDESPQIAPAEDWDLFIRLILGGSRVGIVDEPLMRYRKHPASMTANRSRALRSRVAVLEKTRLHPGLTSEERRCLDRCLARARSRSVLVDAKGIAAAHRRGGRHRLLALATTSDVPTTTRLTLAVAAFVPLAAMRILGWKEGRVARSRPRHGLSSLAITRRRAADDRAARRGKPR